VIAELGKAVESVRTADKKAIHNAWNDCLLLVTSNLSRFLKLLSYPTVLSECPIGL
jgi:hypothetical protein